MKIPKKSILEGLRNGKNITPRSVPFGKYVTEVRGFILEKVGFPNAGEDSEIFKEVNL